MCTSCPSPTPFGLGLGPTDPGTINVAQETLDLRRAGFSPAFTLLVPAFALVHAPHGLTFMLHRSARRSSTNATCVALQSFGTWLEPRSFSAPLHSTSELLRTL